MTDKRNEMQNIINEARTWKFAENLTDTEIMKIVHIVQGRTRASPPVPDDVADLVVLSSEIQGVGNYLNCYCKTWNISFQKIVDRLRTEITMHKAWEKRAYQAEKELNDFRAASTPSAEVRALREALDKAAKRFRHYEELHRRKDPPDEEKAKRNGLYADECEQALNQPMKTGDTP
jgi:hypothetical protein